ncbi:guanylate kinase, partial [Acinetobacter baumannii]
MHSIHHKGTLFIVCAPSGAGKSSLVKALLSRIQDIKLSISFTTRPPRPGEVNGVDYFFISSEQFAERKEKGEFL